MNGLKILTKKIKISAYRAQLRALKKMGQQKKPVDLSVIKHPTLVANGEHDRMVPTPNTHDLAKRLPNSQLIIYPDAGHGGIFQYHKDFVKQTLDFLAKKINFIWACQHLNSVT